MEQTAYTLPGSPVITVETNVPCAMRDGTVLRADVYRPEGDEALPVLLLRTPYGKSNGMTITYAHPAWYAARGYIVVVQDTRGRWASDGEFMPFLNETEDGVDTIAWASRLPGSTGQVGTYGFSYAGATQLLPARERPEGLAAAVPAMTGSQYYEGWTYTGGALNLSFAATWATDLATGMARRRKDAAEIVRLGQAFQQARGAMAALPLNAYPPLDRVSAPWFFDWLDHPTYDEYWRRWSIDADYSKVTVPALHIAGWWDVFLRGTVKNYVGMRAGAGSAEARAAQRLVIGPWHHMPWFALEDDPGEDAHHAVVDEMQIAYFDHVLKGKPLADDAPVKIYVQQEGRWHSFQEWPPAASVETSWHLHSAGSANSRWGDGQLSLEPAGEEPPDRYGYDPLAPSMSHGGHSCCFDHISPMGPADQGAAERWNGMLVYTSPPLERDLLLVGDARVVLHAASSAVDTDWAVRLCIVNPDGQSTNVQEGIVRARYRHGTDHAELLTPHAVEAYEIPLGPVGILVREGWRIRLDVTSSDFPLFDRNMNTGGPAFTEGVGDAVYATQSVLHDAAHPSRLILPVVTA